MEAAPRILVVEDDRETRELVTRALREEGWLVTAVSTAERADEHVRNEAPAAVVLDLGLPDEDGVSLCARWRKDHLSVPVLMLTARGEVGRRVEGLDAGADDYLAKPFALAELRARIRALTRRRRHEGGDSAATWGPLRVDFGRRMVTRDDGRVPLTRREFDVLERLLRAEGRVVTRDQILEDCWGEVTPEGAASLEVIAGRLRRKLSRDGEAPAIRTVRGVGYAMGGGEEG